MDLIHCLNYLDSHYFKLFVKCETWLLLYRIISNSYDMRQPYLQIMYHNELLGEGPEYQAIIRQAIFFVMAQQS
jgi:hypothetical protein